MKRKLVLSLFIVTLVCLNITGKSPYITRVFEYTPAPGQFVNALPKWNAGDTPDSMALKAEKAIANNNKGLISLGGYGGYVVLGFDHTILNLPDSADFKVLANAFWSAANTNSTVSKRAGSSEPGIVMVSVDVNKNGLPDDEWYELAGSEYNVSTTLNNYEITYYKPDPTKTPTPDNNNKFLTDTTYVKWTTNGQGSGYVYKNSFHSQSYWPQWISGDKMTITGTKLANNYIDESGTGSAYLQYAYAWGYADNAPNTDPKSNLDIARAVDKTGNTIHLDGIDFIKIYTGVNQNCGWLGETSTEIMGVEDLHPNAAPTSTGTEPAVQQNLITLINNQVQANLIVSSSRIQTVDIYNVSGQKVLTSEIGQGTNTINCSQFKPGIYFLNSESNTIKFIKQ